MPTCAGELLGEDLYRHVNKILYGEDYEDEDDGT
jgi:hypothetical protein